MNTNDDAVILTQGEFAKLHNARSELYLIQQELNDVLNEKLNDRFNAALNRMHEAMTRAYLKEDQNEKERAKYYAEVRARQGLKTEWGNFAIPVNGISQTFKAGKVKVYYSASDAIVMHYPSWLMMWQAADQHWRESGNQYRNVISDFSPYKDGYMAVFEG